MPTPIAAALLLLTLTAVVAHGKVSAEQQPRTVADGIYTDAQAARGQASYEAACARCHRPDLGGADGPALKDDRFNRVFAGKPLHGLYERVTTTMPRNAPASLAEPVYLDILAYLLRENGFPAGARELSVDAVEGVEVRPTRPRPSPPVGDFSYVEVSGCLAQGADGAWMLEQATDPVAVRPAMSSAPRPAASATSLRGGQTFHLIDAIAYQPEQHRGHLWRVRGTLIRLPGQQRVTISSTEMLAPTCR
jgi:mono/diheme cytochrome c family protein